MPLPAQGASHWSPPKGIGPSSKRSLVVFDSSDLATKQDVAPADGWQDSTAGHGTFVRGIAQAAFSKSTIPLVDITAADSLVTEGKITTAIESYPFAPNAVANLSAGTYLCQVPTSKGIVAVSSVLMSQLVGWLATNRIHLVAAAGNDAATREFYPAAYGVRPTPEYRASCSGAVEPLTGLCLIDRSKSVTSVGSLLTSATSLVSYATPAATARSPFSNYGDWVEAWADGSEIVSDYPDAAYWYCVPTLAPGVCEAPGGGTMLDSTSGSAHLLTQVMWSGTSFAAPQAAVWLAAGNPAP
jgi:hypothetical protein